MLSNQEKSTFSGRTQRCSDNSGWEQHTVPEQDGRFGAKHRRLFFDQYANTILGSCNSLRSYQPTSCGCQGSVFFGMDYSYEHAYPGWEISLSHEIGNLRLHHERESDFWYNL